MAERVDLEMLSRDPDLVAILVSAEDVFSFLSRQMSVPPSWAAIVWSESGQTRIAPASRTIESSETRELLLVRTVPFALEYSVAGLVSKEGHEFTASLTVCVQAVPEKAELLSFRESLLGSGADVRTDDLRRHCEGVIRSALAEFAGAREAAVLAVPPARGEFEAVLDKHFRPLGFESGLAIAGDTRIRFESPSYAESRHAEQIAAARRKQQEGEEQLRAAAATARARHLAELGTLLEQAKGMAAKSGGSIADLIKTFDPARRGALYEGLAALNRPAKQTEAILVVAGDEVIAFDPVDPREPTSRRRLSLENGPLRSVRPARDGDKRLLLIGARSGVHVVEWPGELQEAYAFTGEARPRHGFNAAVLSGGCLYATHSEIGLARWRMQPSAETAGAEDLSLVPGAGAARTVSEACIADLTRGARVARDLQVDGSGRLWLSVDDRVIGWRPDEGAASLQLQAPAVVEALLVAGGFVHAGLANGAVLRWNAAALTSEPESIRAPGGGAVGSMAWLTGGGVPRLLIADGRSQLDLHVLGDAYRGEYRCEQRLLWGFASDDCIVGVNDRRDQMLIWRIEEPERPTARIHVGRLCGHSIQDVAILMNDAV
jgi:hypothetical protein